MIWRSPASPTAVPAPRLCAWLGILVLLLAPLAGRAAPPGGPSPGPTPDPGPGPLPVQTTFLDGSLDLGDLGFDWRDDIAIEGTEQLVFRWRTNAAGAAAGRWTLADDEGLPLATGELANVPPAGEYRLFFIRFADQLPRPSYSVRVQALDAKGQATGAASDVVVVERVCPGPVTQFTDAGLGLPIDDQLEAIRKARDVPALGGAIVTEQGIATIGVVGVRKDGARTAAEEGDRWHLGSDTKAMTATLVGILVDRGQMSFSQTIGQTFPEWASAMDAEFRDVTIEQLVAHRAGLLVTSAYENEALGLAGYSLPQRRREYTRRIVHRSSLGVPSVVYKYHNGNFVIAGAMLEKITGRSWEELMQDELFDPLGMDTAGFLAPGVGQQVDEPWGHSDSTGMRVATRGDNPAALGPAGTVHASLRDWAKFIRLHLTGSEGGVSLSASTLARLHTEHASNALWPQRYGWGWIRWDEFGGDAIGHDGSNTSWYASTAVYPDEGFALLAVSNIGGGDHGNGDLAAWDVISLLKARHTEVPPAPTGGGCVEREFDARRAGDVRIEPPEEAEVDLSLFYQQFEAAQQELTKTRSEVKRLNAELALLGEMLQNTQQELERCLGGTGPVCGDVTGDGRVNSIDARLIQRVSVGAIDPSSLRCVAPDAR